jgi:hypothetical protein
MRHYSSCLACIHNYLYITFPIRHLFADAPFSLHVLYHGPITKRRPPRCGAHAESTQEKINWLPIRLMICHERRNINTKPGNEDYED